MSWSDSLQPYRADLYKYLNKLDEDNVVLMSILGTPEETTNIG